MYFKANFPDEEIKELPCIRNKCILYPTCINKKEITCIELEEHIIYLVCYYNEDVYMSNGLFYLPQNIRAFVRDILINYLKKLTIVMIGNYPFLLFNYNFKD